MYQIESLIACDRLTENIANFYAIFMKRKISHRTHLVTEEILDLRFGALKQEMEKNFNELKDIFRDYRDQILIKMNRVMGELENHRIEQDGIKKDLKDLKKHFTN